MFFFAFDINNVLKTFHMVPDLIVSAFCTLYVFAVVLGIVGFFRGLYGFLYGLTHYTNLKIMLLLQILVSAY